MKYLGLGGYLHIGRDVNELSERWIERESVHPRSVEGEHQLGG